MRFPLRAACLATLAFAAAPAFAHDGPPDPRGEAPYPGAYDRGYDRPGYDGPDAREAWLADCRQRVSQRDSGVGGALIGGAVGGLAGNRIAGRGNRTVGTLAGAAVGAVAGAAIDKAEDRGRDRDECEAYFDDYQARYSRGGGYPGYGGYGAPGYAPAYYYPAQQGCCNQPVMGQPMMMVPAVQAQPHCTETVEYVYEDVPVRPARRVIPRRSKVVPDKRVKIAPDKRVPIK
ncbi:glycine zipper 2TM domain-containing protein [Novosphingobium resinovorum]|uniref:glycine zipper 2TM domain-containing protein n=1 Tax=Novosphingobium resinovorum TaxID=158500 RepID=UPI002ED015CC|nr:glycine zipper 2TM domain-containing protein [Novosphingobium resinovorum]